MKNDTDRRPWVKPLLIVILGVGLAAGCRVLRDWLIALYPGQEKVISTGVIILFSILIAYLVIAPFFRSFGMGFDKRKSKE